MKVISISTVKKNQQNARLASRVLRLISKVIAYVGSTVL
jgi:hypothetical protein